MRKSLGLAIAIGSLVLVGCATTGSGDGLVYDVDHTKIALVENYAKQNNLQVIWVNYPQRAVATSK